MSSHFRDQRTAADYVRGWGKPPAAARKLAAHLAAGLERRWQLQLPRVSHPAALPALPESRLDDSLRARLQEAADLSTDDAARWAFSLGKSYPDLIAARAPRLDAACDAVVHVREEQQLRMILALCAEASIAVVPVGGGTSVVGGIEPLAADGHSGVVALDLTPLSEMHDLDSTSRLATFAPGATGPDVERQLARHGLTLGHVPQSFARSTIGGWVATRSAGNFSLRFGKIEKLVASARAVGPEGEFELPPLPAHGAGPGMLDLLVGSEGTTGVISRVTVRLAERPTRVRFASFVFHSFAEAADAARTLVQAGIRPGAVRVSDADETALTVSSAVPGWLRAGPAASVPGRLGYSGAALVLVVMPGTAEDVSGVERAVLQHMRQCSGRAIGGRPARKWYEARFVQPYVRDLLIDRGLLVDTLETAAPWSAVDTVHSEVKAALRSALGERSAVGCHLSHLYPDGASLYFTFMAPVTAGREFQTWRRAKQAANVALAHNAAAVSHQHGVGTMHRDLYLATMPAQLVSALRQVQQSVDPAGVLNPGKLASAAATEALNAAPFDDGLSAARSPSAR